MAEHTYHVTEWSVPACDIKSTHRLQLLLSYAVDRFCIAVPSQVTRAAPHIYVMTDRRTIRGELPPVVSVAAPASPPRPRGRLPCDARPGRVQHSYHHHGTHGKYRVRCGLQTSLGSSKARIRGGGKCSTSSKGDDEGHLSDIIVCARRHPAAAARYCPLRHSHDEPDYTQHPEWWRGKGTSPQRR